MFNATQFITEFGNKTTDFEQFSQVVKANAFSLYIVLFIFLFFLILIGLIGRVKVAPGQKRVLLFRGNYIIPIIISFILTLGIAMFMHLFPIIQYFIVNLIQKAGIG